MLASMSLAVTFAFRANRGMVICPLRVWQASVSEFGASYPGATRLEMYATLRDVHPSAPLSKIIHVCRVSLADSQSL